MKKLISLALIIIFTLSFTACGTGKQLKIATNAEFEPWEFLDNNQKIVGFDIDLMNAIAEKMGVTVKYENMPFESVVASISSGQFDAAISGLTINESRKKSVDFSDPYYVGASQILIVKNDDTVFNGTTKAELDKQLEGKNIGVCKNFTGESYANGDEDWGFVKIKDATVKSYENISLALTDMKNGNVDAIIMDDTVAKKAVAANTDFKVIDIALTTESYGIAVKKGNKDLLDKINKAIKELKDEGKIDAFAKEWKVDGEE